MRERALVGIERRIRRQRESGAGDAWAAQLAITLEEVYSAGDPPAARLEDRGLDLREVEQRSFRRPLEVVDRRRDRGADEEAKPLAVGLQKCLNPDVARDFVSRWAG